MDSEGLLLLNSVVKMKRRIISDPSCFVQTIREMHRCIIIRIAHVLCLSYRDEPVLSHDDGKYRVMRMLWGIGTPYPGTIIKESRILSPIQISIIASVLRPNVPNTPILSVDQPQN